VEHPVASFGGDETLSIVEINAKIKVVLTTCLVGAAMVMSSFAPTSAFAAQDCAGLANLKIDETNLLSAAEVPASSLCLFSPAPFLRVPPLRASRGTRSSDLRLDQVNPAERA
jgi:hypothetical protein